MSFLLSLGPSCSAEGGRLTQGVTQLEARGVGGIKQYLIPNTNQLKSTFQFLHIINSSLFLIITNSNSDTLKIFFCMHLINPAENRYPVYLH